ncbi:hypothetical protein V501_02267 [Pseudogymnoascus sp. VKM F-4519 (FW-2642)]|nr:hypothetical protein V501_02267 [Pseudogymnoascus sp. VKM F-4519 (FW-2642)]
MNSCGLDPFVKSHDNTGSKCQASPIVRGKKEDRKWQGGVGVSQTLLFEVNGDTNARIEKGFKMKAGRPGDRKESLVQMRIRLLEQSQKTRQNHKPTIPKEREFIRLGGHNSASGTVTGGKAGVQTRGSKETEGEEMGESHPHIASWDPKSLGLAKPANCSSVTSVTSPKVNLEMHAAPCSAKLKLETAAGSESEAQQESTKSLAFKIPFYHRKKASRKSLAPIIRERIKMFESTRDSANANLAVSDGPSALPRGQVNDKGKAKHASKGEIFGVKEVAREKQVKVGRGTPATNQLNKTMSAFSKCLAERKRSRTGCMVDGKYVSAFAYRGMTKETSASNSWTTTTESRESEPSSPNDKSIMQTSSRPETQANGIASRQQPPSKQQSNPSRQPIPSSSYSGSRPSTLFDWSYGSYEASPLPLAIGSISSSSEDSMTQRRAPTEPLPEAKNLRISDIIAMANGREQFAAHRRILQEHPARHNVGRAGIGAWVDSESSEDEDGTLIIKSVAKLREPKPLRMTEVSSLAKICRLGRSRGDLE